MRVALIVVGAIGALQQGSAVSLRASPVILNKTGSSNETIDAVMSMVGAMQDKMSKPTPTHAPGSAAHHPKIDLGFTGFEANLTQQLTASMRKVTPGPRWTDELRNQLIANVTASVSHSLKDSLKAVKQSVGKTWVALPDDDQKEIYANQLRHNFDHVFQDMLSQMVRHFDVAGTRITEFATMRTPLPPKELVASSEKELTDIILTDRCFETAILLQLGMADSQVEADVFSKPTSAAKPAVTAKPAGAAKPAGGFDIVSKSVGAAKDNAKQFCMPSVVSKLAGRLNDAQSVLSMTMRFDAGAMDLLQTAKHGLEK